MKVFVNDVDLPIGKAISRMFACTPVSSRKPKVETDSADAASEQAEPYMVLGTLSIPSDQFPEKYRFDSKPLVVSASKSGVASIDNYSPPGVLPKWVTLVESNQESIHEALLAADIVVFSVEKSAETARNAIEYLEKAKESFTEPKTFLLVSNLMTWAKSIMPEDSDASLTEEDYRKRKAHPSYKDIIALERDVLKHGKRVEVTAETDTELEVPEKLKLQTCVVCTGIVYHGYDGFFSSMFKAAWKGEDVKLYGSGEALVPMIALADLANVVVELSENVPAEQRYIVALDESKTTLLQVAKAFSEQVGNRNIQCLKKEDGFLEGELNATELELSQLSIRVDASSVRELGLDWYSESGLVENIKTISKEFADCRGLKPCSLFVHGPPLSGKTSLSKMISEAFDLVFINAETVVATFLSVMAAQEALPETYRRADYEALAERLKEMNEYAASNAGTFSPNSVVLLIQETLKSSVCSKSRGYVLEGYPATLEDAAIMFADEGILLPSMVFELELSDDAVRERVGRLAESELQMRGGKEGIIKKLEEFHTNNSPEASVLDFFHEREIQTVTVGAEKLALAEVAEICKSKLGRPCNYGPTKRDIIEDRRKAEEARILAEKLQAENLAKLRKEDAEKDAAQRLEWNKREEQIRQHEAAILEVKSEPLRQYLVKNVMPVLIPALTEVVKVRPTDPLEFVADFLFRYVAKEKPALSQLNANFDDA